MEFLTWYNVIFLIPIVLGLLAAAAACMGIGGGEADHDIDHDLDHDVEHGVEGHGEHGEHAVHGDGGKYVDIMSMIGVGRVPLSIILTMLNLIFGFTGLAVNLIFAHILPPYLYFWVSLVVATLVAFIGTGKAARLVQRFMPTNESYCPKRSDLVGITGKLVFDTTPEQGEIKIYVDNALMQVSCRTNGERIKADTEVTITDYIRDQNVYIVERDPFDKLQDPTKAPGTTEK